MEEGTLTYDQLVEGQSIQHPKRGRFLVTAVRGCYLDLCNGWDFYSYEGRELLRFNEEGWLPVVVEGYDV